MTSEPRHDLGVTPIPGCYTSIMPTSRPRHAVTETDEVSRALEAAAKRWPEDRDRPGKLLRRLIAEGHRSLEPALAARREKRLAALERLSGACTGMYEPGYLESLRDEWPE